MILVLRNAISYPLTVIRRIIDSDSGLGYKEESLKSELLTIMIND